MNLQEKLKIDQEAVTHAMVFFVDGKFYAAYERSAFLATRLLPPLRVICRYRKVVDQPVAQIGFPASSLQKFASNFQMEQREDFLLLSLPADKYFSEEEFLVWKQSLPMTKDADGPHPNNKSQASILESIRTFPLESRTPIDAMIFVADLKKRLLTN